MAGDTVARMGGRRLVPVTLLGLMTLLAAGAVAWGLKASPTTASVAVDNATVQTYGAPLGSVPFTLEITVNVSALGTPGVISQVRRVVFSPPSHMVVYQTAPIAKNLGMQSENHLRDALRQYAVQSAGSGWTHDGVGLWRTESLADYTKRVTPGRPLPKGRVYETAEVRNGYLVLFTVRAVVPRQQVQSGGTASGGVTEESYRVVSDNGKVLPSP